MMERRLSNCPGKAWNVCGLIFFGKSVCQHFDYSNTNYNVMITGTFPTTKCSLERRDTASPRKAPAAPAPSSSTPSSRRTPATTSVGQSRTGARGRWRQIWRCWSSRAVALASLVTTSATDGRKFASQRGIAATENRIVPRVTTSRPCFAASTLARGRSSVRS